MLNTKLIKNMIMRLRKPFKNLIKFILLIAMLVLTYEVSNTFIDYILTIDAIMLKRIVNIILVALIILSLMPKAEKKQENIKK